MAKALVIYHANCNDGFGAAYAFWLYAAQHYEEVKYHPASYQEAIPLPIDDETEVFILDFSYHPKILVEIANAAKLVILLDHHKTAMEAWNASDEACDRYDNLTVKFDMTKSGAMLAYEYFRPSQFWADRDIFFEFLQDRDLWQFKNPDTKNFTQYLRSFPQDFKIWDDIAMGVCVLGPDKYSAIMQTGEGIQRRFDQMCKEIIGTNSKEIWINGIKGLQANTNGIFASDVGNLLAQESGTYGATWYNNRNGELIFSLRSIGDFDVSAIAKSFGGGGHKNAAGFKIPSAGLDDSSQKRVAEAMTRISSYLPQE